MTNDIFDAFKLINALQLVPQIKNYHSQFENICINKV